jgi:hypothetical protein
VDAPQQGSSYSRDSLIISAEDRIKILRLQQAANSAGEKIHKTIKDFRAQLQSSGSLPDAIYKAQVARHVKKVKEASFVIIF